MSMASAMLLLLLTTNRALDQTEEAENVAKTIVLGVRSRNGGLHTFSAAFSQALQYVVSCG